MAGQREKSWPAHHLARSSSGVGHASLSTRSLGSRSHFAASRRLCSTYGKAKTRVTTSFHLSQTLGQHEISLSLVIRCFAAPRLHLSRRCRPRLDRGRVQLLAVGSYLIRRLAQCTPRRAITFRLQLPARRRRPGARSDCICNAIGRYGLFLCVLAGARYFSGSDHCCPLPQLDIRLRADLVALSREHLKAKPQSSRVGTHPCEGSLILKRRVSKYFFGVDVQPARNHIRARLSV